MANEYLLLCWDSNTLKIYGVDDIPERVEIDGWPALENACPECNDAYFTGFVDYLRSGGNVIGIRFVPFDDYESILTKHSTQTFLEIEPKCALLIFWTASHIFDNESSGDQEFGGNKLFASRDGIYKAISVKYISDINFHTIVPGEHVVFPVL